jgi:hypothetical protein
MKRAMGVTLLLLVAVFATSVLACQVSVECPIHKGHTAYLTDTKLVDGALVGFYHCAWGVGLDHGHDVMVRCK